MSFIMFCRIGQIPELGHLANYYITCKNKGFDSRPAHAYAGAPADPAHRARKLRDRDGVFAADAGVLLQLLVVCAVCERRKSQSRKGMYDRVTGS